MTTTLERYVCRICDVLPRQEKIFKCERNHMLCYACSFTALQRCSCGSANLTTVTNPLVKAVEPKIVILSDDYCPYKSDGCSWVFSDTSEFEAHLMECKFRPYSCIGSILNVWKCNWEGTQHDLSEHIKTSHAAACKFYNYWQSGSVPFVPNKTVAKINVIDAFNKKFMFYYLSKNDSPNVLFLIYLLGRKCDAQKFLIDFELKQNFRKIKFVELCYSDANNPKDMIQGERCIVIPKSLVKSYLIGDEINFRFIIKKKEDIQAEELKQEEHLHAMLAANRITTERNGHRNQVIGNGSSQSRNSSVNRQTAKSTPTDRKNNGHRVNVQVNSNGKFIHSSQTLNENSRFRKTPGAEQANDKHGKNNKRK